MSSFTLPNTPFPEGTSVSAYDAKGYSSFPGVPPGKPVSTASVEGGELTFTGLTDQSSYFAAAQISGEWHAVRFTIGEDGIRLGDVQVFDGSRHVERSKPMLDARDWVGYTESSTDKGPQMNEALQRAYEYEMGLQAVPWKLVTAEPIVPDSFTELLGTFGRSGIEVADGSECAALESARAGAGGATGGTDQLSISKMHFYGNLAGNPSYTDPIVNLDGIRTTVSYCHFEDGYNPLSTEQSRPQSEGTNEFEDGMFSHIGVRKSYGYAVRASGPHDSQFDHLLVRCNSGFGIWSHGTADVWSHCHVYGNSTYAYHSGGGNLFIDCIGEGSTVAHVALLSESNRWYGGWLFAAGGSDGKVGFVLGDATHSPAGTFIENVKMEGHTNGAFKFNRKAENSKISALVYATSGEAVVNGESEPSPLIDWDLQISGGVKYGLEEGGAANKTLGQLTLLGNLEMGKGRIRLEERESAPAAQSNAVKHYALDDGTGKTQALVRFGSGSPIVVATEPSLREVASASPMTVPTTGPVTLVKVTGTTEIKKITATVAGHKLILLFKETAKVARGENLKLAAATIEPTADDVLELVCDGTNWYQCAALSVNS